MCQLDQVEYRKVNPKRGHLGYHPTYRESSINLKDYQLHRQDHTVRESRTVDEANRGSFHSQCGLEHHQLNHLYSTSP